MKLAGTHLKLPRRQAKTCGIYYLWDGAAVLYVGASNNVGKRIQEHFATGLDFAGYFCDPCNPENLEPREHRAIKEFNPPWNTIGTQDSMAPVISQADYL